MLSQRFFAADVTSLFKRRAFLYDGHVDTNTTHFRPMDSAFLTGVKSRCGRFSLAWFKWLRFGLVATANVGIVDELICLGKYLSFMPHTSYS